MGVCVWTHKGMSLLIHIDGYPSTVSLCVLIFPNTQVCALPNMGVYLF